MFHYFDILYNLTVPDGKPVIGPVPGLSNVFVAAGHEGEGLTLVIACLFYLCYWVRVFENNV